jgi:hypothetical protein
MTSSLKRAGRSFKNMSLKERKAMFAHIDEAHIIRHGKKNIKKRRARLGKRLGKKKQKAGRSWGVKMRAHEAPVRSQPEYMSRGRSLA